MCGGEVLLGPTVVPRTLQPHTSTSKTTLDSTGVHPVIWWSQLPKGVSASLFSWVNPTGLVINSDLELSISVIHHACMADCSGVRERTTLYQTDNTARLWWQKKVFSASASPQAHLLLLQSIHTIGSTNTSPTRNL